MRWYRTRPFDATDLIFLPFVCRCTFCGGSPLAVVYDDGGVSFYFFEARFGNVEDYKLLAVCRKHCGIGVSPS